jgi:CheY-like chemotaxis protein
MVKALVVDDERDIELLFVQKFRKEIRSGEFNFHFAFSGEDAVEFLSALNPVDVVLVLSDINMPGMSGFELLKIIRQKFPLLKVVMITAYGDDANKESSKQLGADGFVNKPVNFDELKHVIQELVQL